MHLGAAEKISFEKTNANNVLVNLSILSELPNMSVALSPKPIYCL